MRVAAALVRIAAQKEQAIENKEERFKALSKAWLKKQAASGAPLIHGASLQRIVLMLTMYRLTLQRAVL